MLGYNYKMSCLSFIIPYWYVLLLDKTSWNNHSYLYGLLSILFLFSSANHYWYVVLKRIVTDWIRINQNYSRSIDGLIDPSIRNKAVPNWNYILIKFQIFLLYFYAGVKKTDPEWLGGYSMKNLGHHWVFTPFKYILILITDYIKILMWALNRFLLNEDDIELYIVHLGGFFLDLTVGFWLLWPKSRPFALVFAAIFHLMNSQLFSIGWSRFMLKAYCIII